MKRILINYFIIFNIIIISFVFAQVPEHNRYKKQHYFEDSTNVFWTWYPNPFSPPTINEKTKGLFCGGLTFYCDLSDTVIVALVNNKDSIVYSSPVLASIPKYFGLCYWLAGPNIDLEELPDKFYHSTNDEPLKLLLVVNNRKKCLRETYFGVKKNWYFWIREKINKIN